MISQEELDEKLYKYKSGYEQIKSEGNFGYVAEKVELNNGLYIYIMGMEYPEKGLAPAKDIFVVNQIKKLIIETVYISKYFIPSFLVFAILPFKIKLKVINRLLTAFNVIGFKLMSPSLLQFQHLTPMAQELYWFIINFLKKLGIESNTAKDFSELIVNMINFDNAYRYRIQDLFNETSIEKLHNPVKEIKRLLLINREREIVDYEIDGKIVQTAHTRVSNKIRMLCNIIALFLLHPRIKKAFIFAVKDLNIKKVQPDEADWFWMNVRTGYHYFGKSDEERKMSVNHLKVVRPSRIDI